MNRNIFRYIPPLVCDFSGTASVLFSLPVLNLFYCPASCTQPISECDEIREMHDTFVFFSIFGEVKAIMGSDEEFLEEAETLIRKNDDAELIFIIGTPVPAIVGSDLVYMAAQLQNKIEKPILSIPTAGFESYYSGVYQTLILLAKTFLSAQKKDLNQINLIGYTPLSLGYESNLDEFLLALELEGIKVRGLPRNTRTLEEFRELSAASLNIVLTHESIGLAQYMEKNFDIPYIAGLPIGRSGLMNLLEKIGNEFGRTFRIPAKSSSEEKYQNIKKALVIGEPLFASSLAQCLKEDFGLERVIPISAQEQERKLKKSYNDSSLDEVQYISEEIKLKEFVENFRPDAIFGDPMYKKFLPMKESQYIEIPHVGLSGRLYKDMPVAFVGEHGYNWIKEQLNLNAK